ncbi:multidrug effflux MFS transporter [Sphingobacterium paucimobilis]|uniref:Major facilitator superfamily (MFS) profile domain-containing protein n=1 Tax=Sphingobacterium paucimobilis HER1398 TaxID=1346330 RepID=U2HQ90_9SPHI|nr:multidrug effflux MFS transporter [Sphingobacterium paucimobilis]ERJ57627.1 hypothetical protein M472_02490 [Sphingobacterium paucimobilis HER1398]
MKNQKKSFIWLIIFLVGFPQISETIYTPSLSELASYYQVTGNQIQQTLSMYFVGFAIGVFLWGILSDFIGRKVSMLIGIVVYIVGSFLCLHAVDFQALLLARFIQALGAAVGSNVSQTILRDTYSDKERISVFSKISAVLAFSPAIGPLLGSVVVSIWDISMLFKLLILIGSIALLWSISSLEETLDFQAKPHYNLKNIAGNILADRTFWVLGGLIGTINGIIFSYYGEAPFIFIEQLDFSLIEYGSIGFLVALASFCGARFCKTISTKYSNQYVLNTGNFVFLLGTCTYLLDVFFLSEWRFAFIIILLLSVFVIMFGITCMLPICLSNALMQHKPYLGIAGAVLGLYYYAIVGSITWVTSYFHSSSFLTFPLLLLFWFVVNSGLIALNRK